MVFGGETAESYYDEGVTVAMKGDVRRAIELFQQSVRLDNTNAATYHQLAKCYYRLGRSAEAVKLLKQVVSKRPESIAARLDLGYALVQAGQTQPAREHFETVSALEPDKGRGKLGMAHVWFHEAQWAQSMTAAQEASALSPGFAALFILGKAARVAGDRVLSDTSLDKADKIVEKSIESAPKSPEGYFLRGEIHFVQERFGDALESFRAAQEHTAKDRIYSAYGENFGLADVLCKQGLCYERLGQMDRAREMGARILEMDSEHKLGQALRDLTDS